MMNYFETTGGGGLEPPLVDPESTVQKIASIIQIFQAPQLSLFNLPHLPHQPHHFVFFILCMYIQKSIVVELKLSGV